MRYRLPGEQGCAEQTAATEALRGRVADIDNYNVKGTTSVYFDTGEYKIDKEFLSAELNRLVEDDHKVETVWITREEFDAQPDLARTMTVKPPANAERIRLVKIGDDVDLQSCGGTHVASTGEIGRLRIGKVDNKGARNRRVYIHLGEDA